MKLSPTRGILYPELPDYDVFEASRSNAVDDGTESSAETDESPAPVMARANWTDTVSADD